MTDSLKINSKSDNLTIRRGDFYEDDEPVDKLESAFEAGEKVTSAPPGDKDTVKFGYSSPTNIDFEGVWDTNIPRAEWDKMSHKQRDEEMTRALDELVNIWVEGDE